MIGKLVAIPLLVFVLSLNYISAYGWCESGTEVGEHHVGLTTGNLSDSSCFKSGAIGKIFSFTVSELSTSSSNCLVYPCVYCGSSFMSELHAPGETITCPVGEMLRVGYDTTCTDSGNNIQGVIKVTESVPSGSNYGWLAWLTGGIIGGTVIAGGVVASVGAVAFVALFSVAAYKYRQHSRSATVGDKSGPLLNDY